MTDTPRDVFLKLVHGVCEERWADVVDLYAERTDVCHPFFPLEASPMRSREALRTHFGGGPQPYQGPTLRRRPTRINVHQTTDPEVIVAEFQYEGIVVETGEPFAIPAVFVMRVRDGKIVESRDYLDHLRSAAARGQLPEVLDAIRDHHAKDRVTDPPGHNSAEPPRPKSTDTHQPRATTE
ncbi:nuclear transport factor 2 family protein [Actinomadura napierensis]|uniref:nuclear transport factor 2 family protein n=1 Tax=Actinomadura napierensis TaxID=267854 RepID=UPI0031DE2EB7